MFEVNRVVERFKKKKTENAVLLRELSEYSKSRDNISESENAECNMIYITNHESYRKSYLSHLDKYRRLKDELL